MGTIYSHFLGHAGRCSTSSVIQGSTGYVHICDGEEVYVLSLKAFPGTRRTVFNILRDSSLHPLRPHLRRRRSICSLEKQGTKYRIDASRLGW